MHVKINVLFFDRVKEIIKDAEQLDKVMCY